MKKQIIFLLLLLTFSGYAQDYRPFPSEKAKWAYHFSLEGSVYWTLYYLNGDT